MKGYCATDDAGCEAAEKEVNRCAQTSIATNLCTPKYTAKYYAAIKNATVMAALVIPFAVCEFL